MDRHTRQLIHRGREAYERRDFVAALADFRAVLERHAGFADLHNLAGLCLGFLGRNEEALEAFERAIAVNGNYIEAHLNRSIVLNELGRYDDAQEAFERAGTLELAGSGRFLAAASARLANAHAEVGDLYLAAGAPAEAAEQYRRALIVRPAFHDIRNKLALALLQLGEVEGAELELRAVLGVNPNFPEARLNLGLVLYRSGRIGEAAAEWRAAFERAPENPQARAYLSMLERSTIPHESPDR